MRWSADRGLRPLRSQAGVTYLMVLCLIVFLGIGMTVVGQQWTIRLKRDREAEFLFRATRIQTAIETYVADRQRRIWTTPHIYPLTLDELARSPRPYLPIVYQDPLTGGTFELIKVNGEIRGVKSRSEDRPLDQVHFNGAARYNEVVFLARIPCSSIVNVLQPVGCPSVPTR